MTQSELVAKLHAQFPYMSLKEVDTAIKTILSTMTKSLSTGARVEVRGFGSFSLRRRASREARNPKTGNKVYVPEKSVLYFRASERLRQQVDVQDVAEQ